MNENQTNEFRVPVTKIKKVEECPNSHSLDLCTVFGFQVVAGRGQYKVGDTVIYIPIDSIIPADLEKKLFGEDSKIKLNKSRVRQIKIRGAVSQGMLLNPSLVPELDDFEEDEDVKELLEITKYDPPELYAENQTRSKKMRNRPKENLYFHEYNGVTNLKWYPDLFTEGQEVVYQEKIHGTHVRFALLPYIPTTLWDKILNFFGLLPKYQFCYGSNRVQLQKKPGNKGYYGEDIYGAIAKKYDVKNKLKPHETVYGEIYGPGIQGGYTYGQKEHQLVIFDVKKLSEDKQSTQWLTVDEVSHFCKERALPLVPILYRGPHSIELAKTHTKGLDTISNTDTREGIVIRDPVETSSYMGKKWLKLISEDYLVNPNNTDNH